MGVESPPRSRQFLRSTALGLLTFALATFVTIWLGMRGFAWLYVGFAGLLAILAIGVAVWTSLRHKRTHDRSGNARGAA